MKSVRCVLAVVLPCLVLVQTCQAAKKSQAAKDFKKHEIFNAQIVKQAKTIAGGLEMVKDKKSARRAARRIDRSLDKLLRLKQRERTLPALRRQDRVRIQKKYSPKLDAALKRMKQAGHQAGRNCGGEKTFMRVLDRMVQVGNALQRDQGYLPKKGNSISTGPTRRKSKSRRRSRARSRASRTSR